MDINALSKALTGAIGSNDTEPEIKNYLSTGFAPLNKIISGDYTKGFPYGRIAEIAGPSASGKTLIATQMMAEAQRQGGVAIFVDWERTFNGQWASRFGMECTFPKLIYKLSETWEEGNTVIMQAAEAIRKSKSIAEDAPIVAVLDSIAAAVPQSMMYDAKGNKRPIDSYNMNDTTALARVTSTTLKSINQYVAEFNMIVIYLNQIRTKPGVVYGDPTTTPGGGATEFYCTTRLFTGVKKIMDKTGGANDFIGREIGVTNKKSKITKPFGTTDFRLVYDDDGVAKLDFTTSMIEYLMEIGRLPKLTQGRTTWEGADYYVKALAKKIDAEGKYPALEALLGS